MMMRHRPHRGTWSLALLLAMAFLLPIRPAHAAGTAAGTPILNQASIVYDVGTATGITATASSTFPVDRKVNLAVTALSGTYVSVTAGATGQPLPFLVTNTGNDTQDFLLSFGHLPNGPEPLGGLDNFDAAFVQFAVESGATPGYQPAEDLPAAYIDELGPDQGRTVYIISDIPAGRVSGDISALTLTATALAGGGAGSQGAGLTETAGADTPGVDTVFADPAPRDASHSDASAYRVSSVNVSLVKSAVVSDPYGGSRAQTGATIRYTISVTVSGTGTATAVTVTDPIPANTTYTPGTLRLNGALLTDIVDVPTPDAGDVGGTTPGTVTVLVGDLTSASPAQTVTFEVTIN